MASLDIIHIVVEMLRDVSDNIRDRKDKLRILRIYGRGIEKKFYPGPFSNSNVFGKDVSDHTVPKDLEDYILHHLIRREDCHYSERLEDLEKRFQKCHEDKEIPSSDDRLRYRKTVMEAETDVITKGDFDVVLCTCNESSGSRIRKYIHPIQCIIDEASMVTEPESMAPISISDQVVMIGDHKQLQPVVESSMAKLNGMNISLFERYANLIRSHYSEELSVDRFPMFIRLEKQYRMVSACVKDISLMPTIS